MLASGFIIILLGLFYLPYVSAELIIERLFDVDTKTCMARGEPKPASSTNNRLKAANAPFSEAYTMLHRAMIANHAVWNPNKPNQRLDPGASGLLDSRMNAAHMIWDIRMPEMQPPMVGKRVPKGAELKKNERSVMEAAYTRLAQGKDFLKEEVVEGRQLNPEKASLACSQSAYARAEKAYQIDGRIQDKELTVQ